MATVDVCCSAAQLIQLTASATVSFTGFFPSILCLSCMIFYIELILKLPFLQNSCYAKGKENGVQ